MNYLILRTLNNSMLQYISFFFFQTLDLKKKIARYCEIPKIAEHLLIIFNKLTFMKFNVSGQNLNYILIYITTYCK